ncbi:MAG: FAD-binding oxidoreductase [Actinobacteria bacterium]|nr:FAD-binding oxidoreductase [Actinomycetota bacterium]
MNEEIIKDLTRILGSEKVLSKEEDIERYSLDRSLKRSCPLAVVLPDDAADVSKIVKYCYENSVVAVLRGAGTNMKGLAIAKSDGIVVSFERMNKILNVDAINLLAEVQPGLVTGDLARFVESRNLFYPVNPANMGQCTIGGNVATAAVGLRRGNLGQTKDLLMKVEAVMPDGQEVSFGSRTVKFASGYEIAKFLSGSNGALAVFTGLTVRLIPKFESRGIVAAFFVDFESALESVLRLQELQPSAQMMDLIFGSINSVFANLLEEKSINTGATVILEFLGIEKNVNRLMNEAKSMFRSLTANSTISTLDGPIAEKIFNERLKILERIYHLNDQFLFENIKLNKRTMINDLESIYEFMDLESASFFGHIPDGNFHLVFPYGKGISEEAQDASIERLGNLLSKEGATLLDEIAIGNDDLRTLSIKQNDSLGKIRKKIKAALDSRNILGGSR